MAVIRDGDCLCNRPAAVNLVEVLGQRVGLSGTEELFSRWGIKGWEPSVLTAAQILSGLRERNYVSETAAAAYVEAVRAAYALWRRCAGKETPHAQG